LSAGLIERVLKVSL